MRLAGIDLAWKPKVNGSAIAIGLLAENTLVIEQVHSNVLSVMSISKLCKSIDNLNGIAIDAPLVLNNLTGSRSCEKELSRIYGARKASCHSSNLSKYPEAASVALSEHLLEQSHEHLGTKEKPWQIECYPHPAIIELFGLTERLPYKKGRVAAKRHGQAHLAKLILGLENINNKEIIFAPNVRRWLDPTRISTLKGGQLKQNEDALDAIICLLIALCYQIGLKSYVFGCVKDGYIFVPSLQKQHQD